MEDNPSPSQDPLNDARDGNCQALYELVHTEPQASYKWLLVSHDYGHEDALDYIEDLEEFGYFSNDEDGYEVMSIHFHLAEVYFQGQDGLPVNLDFARNHLEQFLDGPHGGLASAHANYLDALLAQLTGDSKSALERSIVEYPFRAARRRIDRIQRLYDLNLQGAQVPIVIIEHESQLLREEVETVIAAALASR